MEQSAKEALRLCLHHVMLPIGQFDFTQMLSTRPVLRKETSLMHPMSSDVDAADSLLIADRPDAAGLDAWITSWMSPG